MNLKPNKKELVLMALIKKNNFPFRYVGDYSFWIDGFCPDFVSIDGTKKIIELNGDYWHNLPEHQERDKRKLATYKQEGYDALTIWESELKDLIKIKNKIKMFV